MADADSIVLALIRRMVETGALDMDDVNAIADDLEAEDAEAAHQVRLSGIEGSIIKTTTAAEHQAGIRRRSIRLVDPDGGKPDA